MDFLDELSRDTTKVKGDMAEMIKLNSKIAEEEKKIEDAYREIGKIYYKNYADKNDALFQEKVAGIRASESMILGEVKQMITKLKGLIVCPSCGSGQPLGSIFCSVCGTRLLDNSGVSSAPAAEKQVVETPVVPKPVETPPVEEAISESVPEPTVEIPAAEVPAEGASNDKKIMCKVCGTPMAEDMLFCINCGTRRD